MLCSRSKDYDRDFTRFGSLRGQSSRGQGVKKFLNPRGYKILAALDKVAAEYNATPASIALAWVIARPGITAPIASATSIKQLNELTKATELNLSSDAIDLLNSASSYNTI